MGLGEFGEERKVLGDPVRRVLVGWDKAGLTVRGSDLKVARHRGALLPLADVGGREASGHNRSYIGLSRWDQALRREAVPGSEEGSTR